MTELNLAYGFPEQEQTIQMPMEQKQERVQSHAQPPEVVYKPPENTYMQQQAAPISMPLQQQKLFKQYPSYSFWDRMNIKRPEVVKLAIFSLVIVLGISLDRIGTHYITKYLNDNIFTDMQEFLLRLSYPITIFVFLWIVKSL